MTPADSQTAVPIALACPTCHAPLKIVESNQADCLGAVAHTWQCVDGIWRFLRPERQSYFARFITEYGTIRRAEGRGSDDPAYYRALPYRDLGGRMPADWRVRARSFDTLVGKVIQPLEAMTPRPLVVLDVGAGNGWLSNRLAGRGHQVGAIDLAVNAWDGLAAHVHYESAIMWIQAEFDALPFPERSADLVIFNASLHYSTDIHATLIEALRVTRDGGAIAVVDTPVYHDGRSGAQMTAEREARFELEYGIRSDALESENYLTWGRLADLGAALGQAWALYWPVPRWRWTLRRARARLRGHREPASFPIIVGRKPSTG